MNGTQKTKGEAFERLAFTFCKIATLCLLTGRFALPIAASGAALFSLSRISAASAIRAASANIRC